MTNITLSLPHIDSASILFLAKHCPHLRCVTFIIKPSHVQEAKEMRKGFPGGMASVMEVVQALRKLTVKCENLEAVKLVKVKGLSAAKGKGVELELELEKKDFGGVVLWAWGTMGKFVGGVGFSMDGEMGLTWKGSSASR
jgi:hypothetical protein